MADENAQDPTAVSDVEAADGHGSGTERFMSA